MSCAEGLIAALDTFEKTNQSWELVLRAVLYPDTLIGESINTVGLVHTWAFPSD